MKANEIKNIACIGSGVIGASWATTFAMKGYSVTIYDINEEILANAKKHVEGNLEFLVERGVLAKKAAKTALNSVSYTTSIEEAVKNAQFIQESGPERYEIKESILAEIEKYAEIDTIIASSTSGLLVTEIAKNAKHPERCVGGHPYNPPHLIPLVEITKGEKSSDEVVKSAYDFYQVLGKEPVVLNKESLGFIANRLQMALSREIIDLTIRGVSSLEDIDKAMLYGPGLRLGIMGPILTLHLGGGALGAKGLCEKINDSSNLWLKDMASWDTIPSEWPDLAQAGALKEIENRPAELGKTTQELIEFRDNMLIELLKLHKKL